MVPVGRFNDKNHEEVKEMKRKQWRSKQKLEIVLEGLKSQCSVAELCNRYGIQQSMYYKWRDQLLKNGDHVFHASIDQHTTQLEHQNGANYIFPRKGALRYFN